MRVRLDTVKMVMGMMVLVMMMMVMMEVVVIEVMVMEVKMEKMVVHYLRGGVFCRGQDSIGGNSKTFIVANVSPADDCMGETLSALKFAQRAKMVKVLAV